MVLDKSHGISPPRDNMHRSLFRASSKSVEWVGRVYCRFINSRNSNADDWRTTTERPLACLRRRIPRRSINRAGVHRRKTTPIVADRTSKWANRAFFALVSSRPSIYRSEDLRCIDGMSALRWNGCRFRISRIPHLLHSNWCLNYPSPSFIRYY